MNPAHIFLLLLSRFASFSYSKLVVTFLQPLWVFSASWNSLAHGYPWHKGPAAWDRLVSLCSHNLKLLQPTNTFHADPPILKRVEEDVLGCSLYGTHTCGSGFMIPSKLSVSRVLSPPSPSQFSISKQVTLQREIWLMNQISCFLLQRTF